MDKLKQREYSYVQLYIGATFICLAVAFAYLCFNGGSVLSKWFYQDTWDTGNDFFDCIPGVKGYGNGYLEQYPPLSKLFFLAMAYIYSHNNIQLDTAIRKSMTDPRMRQTGLVLFLIFVLFITFVIVEIVAEMFKEEKKSVLLGASIIGTYSVLYAIERGNIIYLSFMFLMYFIAYYQSENKVLKETAFIALALSAGLKLYPAAFGVLLLYEKRWKEAIRTIVYGILALLIPYLMTKQHLPENEASATMNGVIMWAKRLWNGMFGTRPWQIFFAISLVFALIGMIFIGIRGSKHWINVFYAGVLAIICGVQFSYPYAYVFLIPSLVLFLKEEKQVNFKNNIYFMLLCLLHLPLPIFALPRILPPPLTFVGEIKMWVLFVMIISVTLIEFSGLKKVKESREK